MITLRLLGSIDLRGADGRPIDAVLRRPKLLAILAYLAIARPSGFHRKDRLLAMFWPESSQERARHALRQALYVLRQELGEQAIVTRGDEEVALDEDLVVSDVLSFRAALEGSRHREAVERYGGELLPSFYTQGGPEFESWLDAERRQLLLEAQEALSGIVAEEEAKGNLTDAISWARRLVSADPLDESATCWLMRLLARTGDRTAALRVYDEFRTRVTEELGAVPSDSTEALAVELREAPLAAGRAAVPDAIEPAAAAPSREALVRAPRLLRPSAWLALGLLVVATAAWAVVVSRWGGDELARPDPRVVAVLPFRVSGADPQLAYLREGMVDLLAARLGGAGGTRAVDSRTLLAAWRGTAGSDAADLSADAAVELARSLGSGRVLLGEVVGVPSRLVLTASLLAVPAGRTAARASVEGPVDSLTTLVDRLAAQVLALESGAGEHRLAALTSTSLPALKAYLVGQGLGRRGSYGAAIERFERALRHDSTFALAALGLADAGGWVDFPARDRGLALAWAARDRLSARGHARLLAFVGTRYPVPHSGVEWIEHARALLRIAPDQPEAWYELGDALFHNGRYVGEEAPEEQAIHAFEQAIRLDSTFAGPMHHLIDLLAERGDTAAVRRLARMYFAVDSISETAEYLRWRVAAALHDEEVLRVFWNRVDAVPMAALDWILGAIQKDLVRPEDFNRVLTALEPYGAWRARASAALNRGRPQEAGALFERGAVGLSIPHPLEQVEVFNALFWDGEATRGARAALMLDSVTAEPVPADPDARESYFAALCTAERWRVSHGELETVDGSLKRLRGASAPRDRPMAVEAARLCALELEADNAVQRRGPGARRLVAALDSAYRTGLLLERYTSAGNLILARLFEEQGDLERALAAVRRRTRVDLAPQIALSRFLREEGRLAALTGDREGAIRAYRHYLALRSDPEPSHRPQVEQVRAELARLTGERWP